MRESKVVLVTGANKGIGYEIVRQLAKLRQKVILTARDLHKGKTAQAQLKNENLSVDYIPLDIGNPMSIQEAFNKVKRDFGKLDVLINNAAILLRHDTSLLGNDLSVLRETVETNAYSQLMVTRLFIPLIVPGGRVIMTSSDGGSMSDPVGGWSPSYCVSKSLLNAITRHLAYELSSKKIAVNAYDPGWVQTDMGGYSAPGSVSQGADTAVWLATSDPISTGRFYHARKEIPW